MTDTLLEERVEPAKPPGRFRRSWDRHWYAWAFVTPVVITMIAIVAYPLLRGIQLAFTNATERNMPKKIGDNTIPATYEFVGLQNFKDVLTDPEFWVIFLRTVVWTAVNVSFHYVLGLILAIVLNRALRGRAAYRAMLIIPWAIPAFVATYMWRLLMQEPGGLLNEILGLVGIGPIPWLTSTSTGLGGWLFVSCIIVNVWAGVPFMMVALLGGLQSIPGDLYEAAEVDGATPWQRFRYVTIPGLRSVSSTVILLGCIWTFNMFPIIYLMAGTGQREDISILAVEAYRLAFEGLRQYAVASTYGVIILSILAVFAVIYRRMLRAQGDVW